MRQAKCTISLFIAILLISPLAYSESTDIQEIRNLITDYGWHADNKDAESYSALFTKNARLQSIKLGFDLRDQQEILNFMKSRWDNKKAPPEQRRHNISGVKITELTEATAQYRAILTLTTKTPNNPINFMLSGYYNGEVKKTKNGWKISYLEFHPDIP